MSSDLTVGISCDPSSFTSGMTQAREQLNQTTTSIAVQDQSWKSFSSSVLGSIAKIAVPVIKLVNTYKQIQLATLALAAAQAGAVAPTLTLAGAMAFLMSPLVLITAAIALCVGAWYLFTGRSSDASDAADAAGESASKSAEKVGLLGTAWASFKTGLVGDTAASQIAVIDSETTKLTTSLNAMKDSLVKPFVDGGNAMIGYLASLVPVEKGASLAATALKMLNGYVTDLSAYVEKGKLSWLAYGAVMLGGMNQSQAEAFVKQGTAIESSAAATDKLTAKMESQRAAFGSLREIQEQATQAASNAAEVAKISSITTVEAIDQQVAALRAKATADIAAGASVETLEGQTKSLFDALAKQRQGILDGTVVDKAAEQAKRDLAKATEDAAKAAADAAQKELQLQQQGNSRIESLKDQIDLLNGSATNADIAMRELWRSGQSNSVIEEVGKLTEELDRLRKEEADAKQGSTKVATGKTEAAPKTEFDAAFKGSREAATIALRGSGSGSSKLETLAQKQLTETQKQTKAIADNKPPAMEVADF